MSIAVDYIDAGDGWKYIKTRYDSRVVFGVQDPDGQTWVYTGSSGYRKADGNWQHKGKWLSVSRIQRLYIPSITPEFRTAANAFITKKKREKKREEEARQATEKARQEAAKKALEKAKQARQKAEKAAQEKAAREKAAKEKAAREKAAKEKAAREKAAREKAAREKAREEAGEEAADNGQAKGETQTDTPEPRRKTGYCCGFNREETYKKN